MDLAKKSMKGTKSYQQSGLKLYRSTVEDRVDKIAANYDGDTHSAFLRLVFYLVTGLGYDELEPEDLVDGHGEYQIDVLHIDMGSSDSRAVVTIIQSTFSDSLGSTKLIKLHAGLDYLIEQPKAKYAALSNTGLRDKIQEFCDLRAEILPSNIRVQCYYACLGDPSKARGEFLEQITRINSDYGASVGEFTFEVLGPSEIYGLLNQRERRGTKVHEKLAIIYDQNKANLLEQSIAGVSGVICTVTAREVARIVNEHPTVFDENLRRFLGFSGAVNQAIWDSCTSVDDAELFWFLNNGITIVCDDFDINKDFDNPFIDMENLRIVNGCQTSTTLARTDATDKLQPSTKVLVRVFKTKSTDLASRLVVTTNNQNKITSRDLRAQDKIQDYIKTEFERRFGLWYERTPNEFANRSKYDAALVISNQKIGQAYLAIVRRRPSDASRRQYKVWGEHYQSIFNENVYPETYLFVYRISEASTAYKREKLRHLQDTDIQRVIVANGIYHLSRIASFLWRRGDDWNDLEPLRQDLQKLKDEPDLLSPYFNEGLGLVSKIFSKEKQFAQEPSVALKSGRLDEEIDTELYSKIAQHRRARAYKKTKKESKAG
jgi:hypothetical protein